MILHVTRRHYTIRYCISLYCTILYYILLYYIILGGFQATPPPPIDIPQPFGAHPRRAPKVALCPQMAASANRFMMQTRWGCAQGWLGPGALCMTIGGSCPCPGGQLENRQKIGTPPDRVGNTDIGSATSIGTGQITEYRPNQSNEHPFLGP